MYLLYTLKGIILRRLMSDLRIDTGLWPTLNQSGASPRTADRARLVLKSLSPGLRTGKDGLAER